MILTLFSRVYIHGMEALLNVDIIHAFSLFTEAGSGLIELVVMANVFFNNQQHEIKTKRFRCVKQIKPSFFSSNGNQHFYSQYMQNGKTGLYRKLNFQSKLQ